MGKSCQVYRGKSDTFGLSQSDEEVCGCLCAEIALGLMYISGRKASCESGATGDSRVKAGANKKIQCSYSRCADLMLVFETLLELLGARQESRLGVTQRGGPLLSFQDCVGNLQALICHVFVCCYRVVCVRLRSVIASEGE